MVSFILTILALSPNMPHPADDQILTPWKWRREQAPKSQVVEGKEEIVGEAKAEPAGAKNSWKTACEAWKRELNDRNPGRVVAANCGKPSTERDPVSFSKTTSSVATYQVRVDGD